jgi:chemotaxis protein CheD
MSESEPLPTFTLSPGTVFGSAQPYLLSTLLGSCVAVCLWDRSHGGGGMTHSMLPRLRQNERPSPLITDIAIDMLIEILTAEGCRIADLEAKLFGGGWVLGPRTAYPSIGDQNLEAARERLACYRIPLVAERLGGNGGLVLKQNTATGEVFVRPIAGVTW